jgi:hypothetical protein
MQSIKEEDLAALHARIKTLEGAAERPDTPSDDTLRELAETLQVRVGVLEERVAEVACERDELSGIIEGQKVTIQARDATIAAWVETTPEAAEGGV